MKLITIHFSLVFLVCSLSLLAQNLQLNERGYFTTQGLDVTVFDDIYPEGHQTGVSIIQHGERVVANGDLRLEISPGQWSPVPKGGSKLIDQEEQRISQELWYPDSTKNRKGFNPVIYPDLQLKYSVHVQPAEGNAFKITVDLEEPIPAEWVGKIGFNMELFPGHLFGKSYIIGGSTGIFTPAPNGPVTQQIDGELLGHKLGSGNSLIVAPASDQYRISFSSEKNKLELWDGRINHNNSWYIIRSEIPPGQTERVIEWTIIPNVLPDWTYKPVIQVSQVGYHPDQSKVGILETDPSINVIGSVDLYKHDESGIQLVKSMSLHPWGDFLRYKYYQFDFSDITEPGVYTLVHGEAKTHPFQISPSIYERHVWQPVLEYYLPVQMCHLRINEKYRVWHDRCHMDDALMAPLDTNHFDGYLQKSSTLTKYDPYEIVPELDRGGWHDAGDYDLRVESQIGTVWNLALMLDEFEVDNYDATLIDQKNGVVEIHVPDGQSDIIQQMEHGLLSVLGGYRSLGRLYRGIICNDLRQYVMLGDAASMTDNKWANHPGPGDDDRWVFTEENPHRELYVSAGLAAASRGLKEANPKLADESLQAAKAIYAAAADKVKNPTNRIVALVELILTTNNNDYKAELIALEAEIVEHFSRIGWVVGRVKSKINNESFLGKINQQAKKHSLELLANAKSDSPYGVPYKPNIWGAGWNIQRFGVQQYFFYKSWPEYQTDHLFINAFNFILGAHPGSNSASFASGVGSQSVLVAYGVNRGDWSYIPGGVASGTALIRPDLPELKVWPFFWQQTEYVMGGGSTNFMFLALAVRDHFNKQSTEY